MRTQREPDTPQRRECPERATAYGPLLPAQNARQGVTGHHVRYVLGFGTAAIVIVFVVIYLIYFG